MPCADAAQAAVVRQWPGEVVAEIPAHAEATAAHARALAPKADTLGEPERLGLEDDDRADGKTTAAGRAGAHLVTHELQIERSFQMAILVIRRDQCRMRR